MSTSKRITTGDNATMPQDMASAMTLFAQPLAGMAAASMMGMSLANHAWGLWLGAMSGTVEASQKRLAEAPQAVAPEKPELKLVVSKPAPRAKAAPAAKAAVGTAAKPAAKTGAVQPAPIEKPASPDDLKAIGGIGPKLEKVLNGLGIWNYGQIAALTDAEIVWLDDKLGFAGRIDRDDWVGQAKALGVGQ